MRSFLRAALAALVLIGGGAATSAVAGDQHDARVRAQAAAPCGFSGGTLSDPAQTQRCLAERYKAAKQKPATNTTTPAPSTGG